MFGALKSGAVVDKVTLRNPSGITATFINYGATLLSLLCPDRKGACEEVTLNRSTLEDVVHKSDYFGVTTGRVANRIARGRFSIDGVVRLFVRACEGL